MTSVDVGWGLSVKEQTRHSAFKILFEDFLQFYLLAVITTVIAQTVFSRLLETHDMFVISSFIDFRVISNRANQSLMQTIHCNVKT